ncbi:MAG: 50S ribosomal protein L5, partial [Fervidobacterium sp.]
MAYEFVPLKEKYQKEVVPVLMKEFGYKNIHEVPKLVKVVVNMGVGEGS